MTKSNFLLWMLILITISCDKKFETQNELTAYLRDEDNGYVYTKTVNGVDYVLQYKPTDELVWQEIGDKKDKTEIDRLRKNYHRYLYFNLSMSKDNEELLTSIGRNKMRFGKLVNDLAFEMENKVHLYTPEKDTIEMTDFIYPRLYGMTKLTSLLIVYPRNDTFLKSKYLNFVIEDLGLYTGDIKFKLQTEPLKREPQLSF